MGNLVIRITTIAITVKKAVTETVTAARSYSEKTVISVLLQTKLEHEDKFQ
jgi:hypothetical protein